MENSHPDRSKYLMFGAVAYTGIIFIRLVAAISTPIGVFSVMWLDLIWLPLLAIIAMTHARFIVRFHWAAMVGFVCWILATAFVQLLIFAQAAASV